MMSGIRGTNTTPERIVRSFLHRAGLRFRLHVSELPGKPDIVLPRYRAVVEVRGCFWHQHVGCRFAYKPKSRLEFWIPKLRSNVSRDKKQRAALENAGWHLFEIWECSTHSVALTKLVGAIRKRPVPRR
jgi:DNA mismatch endonuclease (patch repair protein)